MKQGGLGLWANRLSEYTEKTLMTVACIAIILGVVMMITTTVLRFTAGINFAFMQEFPPKIMPYVAFLTAGVLFKRGKHIEVSILADRLKGRAKSALKIYIYLVVIGAAVMILNAFWITLQDYFINGAVTSEEIEVPIWLLYLAPCVGFLFLIIFSLEMLGKEVKSLVSNFKIGAKKD